MIITRTPLRLSFVGGGSDLPSFYENNRGAVISTAINKYVYINLHPSFSENIRLAYSRVEQSSSFEKLEHPIVKNAAHLLNFSSNVEITSIADIPANGTGLGSSSAFTVGLLNAISHFQGDTKSKYTLAQMACQVEIDMCNEPIGKQDQFASSFGGMNKFTFKQGGAVERELIKLHQEFEHELFSNLLVFYTGKERRAATILTEQKKNNDTQKNKKLLGKMVDLVDDFAGALHSRDLKQCGEILDTNWFLKKQLSSGISNSTIDEIYSIGKANGAFGGKLLGAGAGGFIIFIAPSFAHKNITRALTKLKRQFWLPDQSGTSIIHSS